MSSNESKKRKRVSKNKKRNWRKTDIDDVEEYVEDQRLEERTGGAVATKTDTDLFFVDKDVEVEPTVPVKKKKKETKPLKCHAILELDSKIKPIKVARTTKTEEEKVIPASKEILSATTNNRALRRKQTIKERRKGINERRKQRKIERQSKSHVRKDLWAENGGEEEPIDNFHNLYTRKTRPKPPKHMTEKPSGVSAVEPALPGQSYNPTFQDHQDLIMTAAIKEQGKVDEAQKITRSMSQKFPSLLEAPTEKTYIDEMSVGLFEQEEPQTFTEEELTKISVNPPVRREDKKTKKQRRKEQERKQQEEQRRLKKEEKLKKNEYFRIKSIKKELNKRDTNLKEKAQRKAELKEKTKDHPKRLGKYKFEEPDLELKLSDELEGTLRQLKPEGHLLFDRYKSMQKRNIIEPRPYLKKERRRKNKKWAEKKGHKEITA